MTLRLLVRLIVRELRGTRARIVPFLASLAIGVAAVVLVAGLGDSVSRAIRMEARPLLGADVAARSSQPIPASFDAVATAFPEVERADTVDLLTMVAVPPSAEGAPGRSLMAELKAVSSEWPFYGAPTLEPARPLADLLDTEGVVVEPALLERLGLASGAQVRIGGATFTVRGLVVKEPGRLPSGMSAGPRVLMSLDGLARAGLGATGARITHRALFRAPDEARAAALAGWLKDTAADATWTTIETWSDAQPSTQRSIERTSSYLGLVALLSLVVGGVGVAQSTRAWMARRLDALAVQRCLGLTTGDLRTLALAQTAVLAAVGSGVGAIVGVGALAVAPLVLEGLLPAGAVQPWQPGAIARGVVLGVGVALLFAARPLDQASRVPPLRVLRRDVEPLPDPPLRAAIAGLALGGGVYGLAWLQARDPIVAGAFVGGLAAVAGLGVVIASLAARGLGRFARGVRPWWLRHGLASVGRPGAGLVPAVVSLAIGVVVVLTTVLVEGRIFAQISEEFPAEAPSAFLVDVRPDQREGVIRLLDGAGATQVRWAPMVVARLLSVDDRGVEALVAERGEGERWSLTREQRLSYMAALPPDNVVVAGASFSDSVPAELSLEQRYAESLGATVGSRLRFDVQGVPIDFTVTSLRTVSWESFNMNFFLVAEPGVLEAAPQSMLVTAQLPAEREAGVQDQLAAAFPNVTLVSVRAALTQARGLLERMAWGIRAVGAFTALAGIAILVSGVAADAARQGRKVALYKTLGTTRAGVVGLFAIEYGIVGLLAGVLGAGGAWVASYAVVTQLMRLGWRTDFLALFLAVGLTAGLSAMVGVLANTRALRVRPAEVLRGE
ncbi:MAG: ABC transporter permease [Pseudomonadota bacterium]|nr:ABC transporter permease [Pseudomonadota bacterium]